MEKKALLAGRNHSSEWLGNNLQRNFFVLLSASHIRKPRDVVQFDRGRDTLPLSLHV
jgi:hypothetical protein